jgi:anti-anti-sigma factor
MTGAARFPLISSDLDPRTTNHGLQCVMHVDVHHRDDVIVLDLNGDLVLGDGDAVLRASVDELLAEGWRKIVINLSRVHRLDSSGIGELVASWKLANRFDARLKVLRPGDKVKHTMHLTQILPVLEVFEDEKSALASFSNHHT